MPLPIVRCTALVLFSAIRAAGLSTGEIRPDANEVLAAGDVTAAGSSSLASFQVGSFEGGADAVLGGHVQSAWLPSSPTLVGPEEGQTRLWALLADMGAPRVPLEKVSVTSAEPSVATAHMQWRAGGPRDREQLALGNMLRPLVADVVYECWRSGAAGLVVAYHFADPQLASVELSLTKECTQRPRVGLCLGTSPKESDNVVHNGRSRWVTSSATQHIIPAEQTQLDFFWMLRPSTDTALQLLAPPRAVITPLATGHATTKIPGTADLRRWQRHLSTRSAKEASWNDQGVWGLLKEQVSSDIAFRGPEIVRVRFTGDLEDGGALPVESSLPAHSQRPSLGIELECLHRGVALVQIEVAPFPAYQPYRPAVIAFLKECGGSIKSGFDVATHPMSLAAEVAAQADLIRGGMSVGRIHDVSNVKDKVVIYWRSLRGSPAGPPDNNVLTCTGGVADAFVSQPLITDRSPDSDELAGHVDLQFKCKQSGMSSCMLKLGWKLFEGPRMHFHKICGGIRKDVDITSDMPNARLVLLQGQDQAGWGLNPQVTLPAEEDKTIFTVSLDRALRPGEEILSIAPPQLRVFRPDVLKAEVVGDLSEGGEVDSSADGSADIGVEMKCLKSGASRVEVTLPIGSFEPFKPLSFAFMKKCVVIEYYQQWWFVVLASFGGLFCLSATVMTACVCSFQRKLSRQLERRAAAHELGGVGEDQGLASA